MSIRVKMRVTALAVALACVVGGSALAAEQKPKPAEAAPAGPCKVEEVFDAEARITRIYDFDLGVVIYRQDGPSPSITSVPLAALNLENVARLEKLQENLPAGCSRIF